MPLSAASSATRGPRSPSRWRGAAPGGLAELGRGGPGAGGAGVIGMMRTQCLLGLRTFVAFAAKLWSFFMYLLRRQIRTVSLGWALVVVGTSVSGAQGFSVSVGPLFGPRNRVLAAASTARELEHQ